MLDILRTALFLLFSAQAALAQEQPLPAPMTGKWTGADFCISKELVIELLIEGRQSGIVAHEKEGCGNYFIPLYLTITPIEWHRFSFGDRVLIKITTRYGEEAFSYLEPPKQEVLFPLGVEITNKE